MTSTGTRIRRARAQAAIDAYGTVATSATPADTLTDLLTDLRHWSDGHRLDFARSLGLSQLHHEAETGGAS